MGAPAPLGPWAAPVTRALSRVRVDHHARTRRKQRARNARIRCSLRTHDAMGRWASAVEQTNGANVRNEHLLRAFRLRNEHLLRALLALIVRVACARQSCCRKVFLRALLTNEYRLLDSCLCGRNVDHK